MAKRKRILETVFVSLCLALGVSLVFFTIDMMRNSSVGTSDYSVTHSAKGEDRNYHVLVLGRAENAAFIKQVYEGASGASEKYRAVVECYVPGLEAEDISLEKMLNYASCVNVDGIIAFIDPDVEELGTPIRSDGTPIPLISVGFYSQNVPQACFIGTNYSELGKKIASRILSLSNPSTTIYIVTPSGAMNRNYSTLMNGIHDSLSLRQNLNYASVDSGRVNVARNLSETTGDILYVCLTEEDTISTVQAALYDNKDNRAHILGFGTNSTINVYFEKGLIDELVYVDPGKIGEIAMDELFEYRNTGHANSYIAADVKVRSAHAGKN